MNELLLKTLEREIGKLREVVEELKKCIEDLEKRIEALEKNTPQYEYVFKLMNLSKLFAMVIIGVITMMTYPPSEGDIRDAAEKAWLAIETMRKAFLVAVGVPYKKRRALVIAYHSLTDY